VKALDLDFHAAPHRAAWMLAAAGAALAIYGAILYQEHKRRPAPRPAVVAPAPVNAEELAFARETVLRMSIPWDALFGALERSRTEGVALLSVEPNGESRSLRLTGEAKGYLAVLTYVAGLGQQETLQNVHLLRHEARGGGVSFAISAAWKDAAKPQPAYDLAALQRFFDRPEKIDDWLARLYGIATAKSLQLRQADYRLADSRYGIERYQITLPVSGSYAEIRGFLNAALAEIPVLSLDQASFRRKSAAEPRVETELVLTLHARRG
jgi:hypothetical protein